MNATASHREHVSPLTVFNRESLLRLPQGFLHSLLGARMQPPFFHPGRVAELSASWDTGPRDVLICTAQKVGTHLTKKFVVELLAEAGAFGREHPCYERDIGHGAVPWPEVLYSQSGQHGWAAHMDRVSSGPRLWYTHCDIDDLPVRSVHRETRFILCYRDPRSVAVSQYHFYRRHPLLEVDPSMSIETFAELFLEGKTYFGDYHGHVRRWVDRAGAKLSSAAVLLLRYEALVDEKETSARRIADFLVPGHGLTAEAISRVVERTGFEAMKDEMTRNPQTFHFRPEVFFRAGTTDDWRRQLPVEVAARIGAKTERVWAGSALEWSAD